MEEGKKDWKRPFARKEQSSQINTISRNHFVKPKFVVKAISNTNIMKWIKCARIPHFKGVLHTILHTLHVIPKGGESMIIDLDSSDGSGTHWVASFVSTQKNTSIVSF